MAQELEVSGIPGTGGESRGTTVRAKLPESPFHAWLLEAHLSLIPPEAEYFLLRGKTSKILGWKTTQTS